MLPNYVAIIHLKETTLGKTLNTVSGTLGFSLPYATNLLCSLRQVTTVGNKVDHA